MKPHLFGAATLAALALLGATVAQAAPAVDLTSPGQEFNGATLTLGFQFTVDSPQLVTALGVYDDGKDGLFWDAPVGIWDTEGDLLTSAVVPKGEAGRLDGFFRYVDIEALRLTAGQSYIVAAYNEGDFATSLGDDFGGAGTINPHVRIEGDRFANTGGFEFPSLSENTGSPWLGANFEISGAPEPSGWVLMIAGVGLTGATLRARRGAAWA